jgi:hypothetical protein
VNGCQPLLFSSISSCDNTVVPNDDCTCNNKHNTRKHTNEHDGVVAVVLVRLILLVSVAVVVVVIVGMFNMMFLTESTK